MKKHRPTPWYVGPDEILDSEGQIIALRPWGLTADEWKAVAHPMSVAIEMREALLSAYYCIDPGLHSAVSDEIAAVVRRSGGAY